MEKFAFTRDVEEHFIFKADSLEEAIKVYRIVTNHKDESINDLIKQYNIEIQTEITNYEPIMEDDDDV